MGWFIFPLEEIQQVAEQVEPIHLLHSAIIEDDNTSG